MGNLPFLSCGGVFAWGQTLMVIYKTWARGLRYTPFLPVNSGSDNTRYCPNIRVAWTLPCGPPELLRSCPGRRPWGSYSVCISARRSPPASPPHHHPHLRVPSAAEGLVPFLSPAPAKGSHIDCILHFLLWGRREPALTHDQRLKFFLIFVK